jgi:mRNA-degrading endonuclease toxin of MazEF toxin-antitoxin module
VPELTEGRLVWVELSDPQGRNPKVRPAVVLTPTEDIRPDGVIAVAAVTGVVDEIPKGSAVPLPWDRRGHPETKLTKPCAVACHWTAAVPVSAVQSVRGFVPARLMYRVRAAMKRSLDDDAPTEPPPPPPPNQFGPTGDEPGPGPSPQ